MKANGASAQTHRNGFCWGRDLGRRFGFDSASSWCTVHGTGAENHDGKRLRRIISCTSNLYM